MPRVVDHVARRREIATVAQRLLARDGASGLSLRNIAAEMGGSLTLVTHYYANRHALMTDLARQTVDSWQTALHEMDAAHQEPRDRLRTFLAWLLPLDDAGLEEERARFALLAADHDPDCRAVLLEFDHFVRELLCERLAGLVPTRNVAAVADLLRAFTSGVVIDAVLSPPDWPEQRQLALLDSMLASVLPE